MQSNINDFNNIHLDILREVGNIGAGNAATALAKMLNKRVDMDVPKVKILEFKQVSDILGGAEDLVIGILLAVEGDINGDIMFILDVKAARTLVNILMGDYASDRLEFNEIELSALKEIGNILAGSYLSALSSLTGLKMVQTVPDIALDMAGAILSVPAIEFGKVGDTVLYIETEFNQKNEKVFGNFFLIPDISSYDVLLRALGVED